jgi:hypothetical protein
MPMLFAGGRNPGPPAAPANVIAPTISGTAKVYQTLTAHKGSWTGSPFPIYTYQWKANGTNIGGATARAYILTPTEIGKTITVAVTATNSQGTASATSAATAAVADLAPPVNTVAPVISGSLSVGSVLTASTGTWTGDPTITYAYQWTDDHGNISGATSSTYTIGSGEVGLNIGVTVTATNPKASVSANASTVGPVTSGGGGYVPAMKFNDNRNSMYLELI